MNVQDIMTGGGAAFIVLTMIQISPVQINPWSWILSAIGRAANSELIAKVDALSDDIANMKRIEDERESVRIRMAILDFCEELYKDERHSKERFDQILQYITDYRKYCNDHPSFPNEKAQLSIAHIEAVYKRRLDKHDFL